MSPSLSFIVVAYNMERELPRTLFSLSRDYQQGVEEIEYEVIVIDNGSSPPFGNRKVEQFGSIFRYYYLKDPPPSPAFALNYGVKKSKGEVVCLMIDGARIVTPGVVKWALTAFNAFKDPTVAVLGWHIGPQIQNLSILSGYNPQKEDLLLQKINFPKDGYRLFEISTLTPSCPFGWFPPFSESNAIFIKKDSYWRIGGYDERFDFPGGGLTNLDFFRRAVMREGSDLIVLLGEGTFHQIHGGVATNVPPDEQRRRFALWAEQYRRLHGEDYRPPEKAPVYLGQIPQSALPFVRDSAERLLALSRTSR